MADYIPREAAIDAIEGINWYKYNDEGRLVQGGTSHDKMFLPYKAVEGSLKAIPAADVRPVVKATWEKVAERPYFRKHYHVVACSACHKRGNQGWRYCPNCGAMMEES